MMMVSMMMMMMMMMMTMTTNDEVRSTEDVMLGHSRLPHLPASSLHTNTMCAADGEDDDADCEGIE